jgi:BirA family biotin operon repressor/biotin-[acetyl-CoA-carboxylase] ligase
VGPEVSSANAGPPPSWAPVVRRVTEVGSTNAELLAAARDGAPEGLVLVAERQIAGRGRRGRRWDAPPGSSLLVSVLLRPRLPALVPLVGGLAAVEACDRVTGLRPALKWPNDVVVGEAKLGGLLAEAAGPAVVVGLGLNVSWEAPLPSGALVLLTLTGRRIDRTALLDAFLSALGELRLRPASHLLPRYREACVTLGRDVRVETATGPAVEGRAVDVDTGGALVVESADGSRRTFLTGDVVHLRGRETET